MIKFDHFTEINIRSTQDAHFRQMWQLYETCFPKHERRELKGQMSILNNSLYQLKIYLHKNEFIGFIGLWNNPTFSYIEHIGIDSAYRNKGYGSEILSINTTQMTQPIILEIDPTTDCTSMNRFQFYSKNGFLKNTYEYYQYPYHNLDSPTQLELLSFPILISPVIYLAFNSFQQEIK